MSAWEAMDDIPGADNMVNMADMDNMDAVKKSAKFSVWIETHMEDWKTKKSIMLIIWGFGRIAAVCATVISRRKKTDIEE